MDLYRVLWMKVRHLRLLPPSFHTLPRPSTPFHALPRPSTPFHALPRPSTPFHDLHHALWMQAPSSEAWLERRSNFSRSLAVMSMVGYMLGLGDRHPSNLMLHRFTGKILHIDFGDCFEVAMRREKFPETVPFRLTRMLVNAMEVSAHAATHLPPHAHSHPTHTALNEPGFRCLHRWLSLTISTYHHRCPSLVLTTPHRCFSLAGERRRGHLPLDV